MSVRPKATFDSIVNRMTINIDGIEVLDNDTVGVGLSCFWELVYNGTLRRFAGLELR